tara:strand:+ start:209 stop:328 length:120 start_codon:yes stop_codon:yes gene_type:complete
MDEAHIKASKDLKKKEYPNRREIAKKSQAECMKTIKMPL